MRNVLSEDKCLPVILFRLRYDNAPKFRRHEAQSLPRVSFGESSCYQAWNKRGQWRGGRSHVFGMCSEQASALAHTVGRGGTTLPISSRSCSRSRTLICRRLYREGTFERFLLLNKEFVLLTKKKADFDRTITFYRSPVRHLDSFAAERV